MIKEEVDLTQEEENRRLRLESQIQNTQAKIRELESLLQRIRNKEENLKREEEAKQPKLTFEMIKQIKHAYSVAKEDRPKLETLENRFEIKMHELLAKIGNKTDNEEFESQIEKIKEDIKNFSNKPIQDSKRRHSAIKVSSPVLQGEGGENDVALRKYIER